MKNMADEITQYLGNEDMKLVEAMAKINDNSKCVLYVCDKEGKLVGSLTDGDIRLWIVKNGKLDADIRGIINYNVRYIFFDDEVDPNDFMEREQINSLPILDSEHKIVKIVFLNQIEKRNGISVKLKDVPIIIMAGGKGTRLKPYTRILPKPLIPINDIPIIERIMDKFHDFGAESFFITVNYRKEMIKSFFSDVEVPYEIFFIEEEVPLGTAGSIRLINKKFQKPVIITNCDTLIQADLGNMLEEHSKQENDLTVISANKHSTIPYGVLHSDSSGQIISMEEKPEINFTINTGMYIINPEFLEWIPDGKVFHMTDLANLMIKKRKRVGMYTIEEDAFLDMGEFEEMKRMEEKIGQGFAGRNTG